jgi:hypothetical protein
MKRWNERNYNNKLQNFYSWRSIVMLNEQRRLKHNKHAECLRRPKINIKFGLEVLTERKHLAYITLNYSMKMYLRK